MFDSLNQVVFQVTKLDILIFLLTYLIFINIISIIAVFTDKQLAINNKRRISEKTLMIIGLLGGSIVEYMTMNFVRHKTLHKKFMIGLPLIFAFQVGLFIWWIVKWF